MPKYYVISGQVQAIVDKPTALDAARLPGQASTRKRIDEIVKECDNE